MFGSLRVHGVRVLLAAGLLGLASLGAAQADIGPGTPDAVADFVDGGLPDGGGAVSDEGAGTAYGAQFSYDGVNPLSRITWYGAYAGDAPTLDDFSVQILAVVGGVVDTASPRAFDASGVLRTAAPGFEAQSIYLFVLDVETFVLDAGDYLLAITNLASEGSPWSWATSANEGTSQSRDLPDGVWAPAEVSLAYALGGPVPVPQDPSLPAPPAAAFVVLGALATAAVRRRRG